MHRCQLVVERANYLPALQPGLLQLLQAGGDASRHPHRTVGLQPAGIVLHSDACLGLRDAWVGQLVGGDACLRCLLIDAVH